MTNWDPLEYARFGAQRLIAARDLLARVTEPPADGGELRITDLGCGAGAATALLRERWPGATIHGLDSSAEMLAEARSGVAGGILWQRADIARWEPVAPQHLLFSNAALHWLDDHTTLFPRLVAALADGGVLAVQMPMNQSAASHQVLFDVAESEPWRSRLAGLVRRRPVADPAQYRALLEAPCGRVEIWVTEYPYLLEGGDAVAAFTAGTVCRPFLAVLGSADQDAFLLEYRHRLRPFYEPRPDGRTLYPFRRLFVVARK